MIVPITKIDIVEFTSLEYRYELYYSRQQHKRLILPNANPPLGKIVINYEPIMQF